MGEASQKLEQTNKHSEMLLECPEHLEPERLAFALAGLCMYMYALYFIMNMIIIGDNL